jgi:hypothetical protein
MLLGGITTMKRRARMMAKTLVLGLGVAATWIVAGMVGCEAGGAGSNLPEGGATTTPTGGGSGGAAGTTGAGGVEFDAGDPDAALTDGDTCLTQEAQAEKIPLDVFMVVDRSGSMGACDYGNWMPTDDALRAFFNNPLSAGLSIGMNFFPAPDTVTEECLEELFNPVQVPETLPLLLLPDNVAQLEAALDALVPGGCTAGTTPMYAALYGTYAFAVPYQDNNPNRKVIVVLTSDGEPCCNTCPVEDIPTIAGLALSARGAGIFTYTIIIDPLAAPALNQIAAQGGTVQAYDVSNDVSQFAQALDEIRAAALSCEYIIPETQGNEDAGEPFDPLKVNVVYTPGGGQPTTIPQADNEADCGSADGWYYDDPNTPTKIILCPHTCNDVQADQEAVVSLAFGCPTELN